MKDRWRAKLHGIYFCIRCGRIEKTKDMRSEEDYYNYDLGNYFERKEDAQKVLDSEEWKEFWEKVRNREIEND